MRGCAVRSLRPRSRLSHGSGGGLMVSMGIYASASLLSCHPIWGAAWDFSNFRCGYMGVCLVRLPGVYRADSDTTFLIEVLRLGGYAAGRRVLDVGTGTGALALAAARAGAASVTAVDVSLRSVAAAWLNSRLHRVACTVRWGDLCTPVADQQFDLILANPPYVPAASEVLSRHRISRCWDGGLDGRIILDRVCAEGPDLLAPEGMMLVVHSAVCDEDITLKRFADTGLQAEVVARCWVPFGPVMRARAAMLEARGLVEPGQREEELVIIGARRGR